jgi:hypothetical protein
MGRLRSLRELFENSREQMSEIPGRARPSFGNRLENNRVYLIKTNTQLNYSVENPNIVDDYALKAGQGTPKWSFRPRKFTINLL